MNLPIAGNPSSGSTWILEREERQREEGRQRRKAREQRGERQRKLERGERMLLAETLHFSGSCLGGDKMSPEDKSPKQPANLLMENERIPANQEVLQERISLRWLCLGVY